MRNHRKYNRERNLGFLALIPHLPCGMFFAGMILCAGIGIYAIEVSKQDWLAGLAYIGAVIYGIMWSVSVVIKYFWYFMLGLIVVGFTLTQI